MNSTEYLNEVLPFPSSEASVSPSGLFGPLSRGTKFTILIGGGVHLAGW